MSHDRRAVAIQDLLHHSDWAPRLARILVTRRHDAEDLLQDAWIDAIRHPPDDRGPVRPCFRTVLQRARVRLAARELKRQRRDAEALLLEAPVDSSETLLLRFEQHRMLAVLISEMPEPYKQTILLRFYEGNTC